MELLTDLLTIIIPTAIVLYVAYLLVQLFIRRNVELKKIEVGKHNIEATLQLRLQAYERITLFLERISPQNLLVRLNAPGLSAIKFQKLLLNDIRNEFDHNITQQVYVSETVWDQVVNAKEDLVIAINQAAEKLSAYATAIELSKRVFEIRMERQVDLIGHTIKVLKKEAKELF